MVRVISEKLFTPPRSRHSSGEAVDKELAARAVEALSSLNASSSSSSSLSSAAARRLTVAELSDYESSSDSHWEWDSEVDFEAGDGPNGNGGAAVLSTEENSSLVGECSGGEDVLQKRKERRRERNKLSAQAYRIRRREQCVKQHTVLKELQDKNWLLKEQVHTLEEEIDHLRRTAVVGASSLPALAPPNPSKAASSTSASDCTFTAVERSPSLNPMGSGVLQEKRSCLGHRGSMDNDPTRCRLLTSPLVDNFPFSQPSPVAVSSPAASPSAESSSSSLHFTFPSTLVTSAPSGACQVVGQNRQSQVKFSEASVIVPAACASSSSSSSCPAEDRSHLSHGRIHPRAQYLSQIARPPDLPAAAPHLIDLNANAEERRVSGNLNLTLHTAAVLGSCQRNDNVNNNTTDNHTTTLLAACQGGARPKTKAAGPARAVQGSSDVFRFS